MTELLETLLDLVSDAVLVKDRAGRFLYVNRAMCELLGRPREALIGATERDFLPAEQAESFGRDAAEALRTGRVVEKEETLLDGRGGGKVLMTRVGPCARPGGETCAYVVTRDITELVACADELKRSQLLLRHAQKLESVGRLVGGVAHDFNNLLTAIVGGANLLHESLPDGHEGRVDALELRKAGERAADLSRRLLSFARRSPPAARPLRLEELVREMRPLLERLLPPHVEIETELPEGLPAVRLDPGEFEQVLLNLVLNARDAMPSGGRVTIALSEETAAGGVLLRVSDTGPGLEAATAARVFEPFFTTKLGGTGLGLATVRDIAAGSGGAVAVESRPGEGASFLVRWPRCERPGAAVEPAAAAPGAMPRRAAVLIAEDDDVVRRFACRCLERAGCDVVAAASGLEALQLGEAHEGVFDVLLLDVVLPGLGGRELAARLRRSQPTARLVLMSGSRPEQGGPARAPFLAKPFSAAELRSAVASLLQ